MTRADVPTKIRNAYGEFAVIPSVLVRDKNLSDGAVRLYALLWDYSSQHDRSAWPKRSEMASDLGCSVDTIDRRVKELIARKAISVEADFDGDRQTSNVYTIERIDPSEVVHRGRKNAARRGRTDAAPGGRKNAAPYKEPEPEEPENYGPVPHETTERDALAEGTGPGITPATVSRTHRQPLRCPDVFAAVGSWLPTTFDDAQLEQLATEIIGQAAARVVEDPTGYVIRAIRNTVNPNERQRGRWLLRADEIALEAIAIRERAVSF